MVSLDIKAKETYAEYGAPSGHAFLGFIIYFYALERIVLKRNFYIFYYGPIDSDNNTLNKTSGFLITES